MKPEAKETAPRVSELLMTARVSNWIFEALSVIGAASLMRSATKVSAQLRR